MYQEVLHALKLLYICIRYLIEECPLLLWGDNSLSDIVRLVNEHLYFLHIYTSNHLLCTYTICYPFKGRRQYKSWNLCPPRLVKKKPIWSNLSNLILYVSLSERNLYRTSQIMNELFYRTLRFVHEVALKRKLVLFCDFIYNNQYIDCLIKSCSFTVLLNEDFLFYNMIHLFPSSGSISVWQLNNERMA